MEWGKTSFIHSFCISGVYVSRYTRPIPDFITSFYLLGREIVVCGFGGDIHERPYFHIYTVYTLVALSQHYPPLYLS